MASDLQNLLIDANTQASLLRSVGNVEASALIDRLSETLVNTALALARAEGRIHGMLDRTNEINRREAERGK